MEIKFCGICGVALVERTMTEPIEAVGPTSESSYLGTLIDGRYRINRLIGRGGMGSVYEVEHVHMQKRLAMKLLHEDMVVRKQLISRFTREARAVSRLENRHTVRVYDFGRHRAVFFLVMEYLDGEDLEIILSRVGALGWRRALKILDQVCEALQESHTAGIIHRDLKPENIMILRQPPGEDYVKVLDFGLAKITEGANDVFSVHSHRDLFGTPFYMSPEQIRSEKIDGRADIYSLGCLLYRMLTNQHVYDAPYAFDVLRQHLTAPIPSVCRARPTAEIPARADRLVWRALSKRPENRFPDAATMRREIQGCLENPAGDSLTLPSFSLDPEPPPGISKELEVRLQAFEASHKAAEARMHGEVEEPPDLPPEDSDVPSRADLPVGIAVPDDIGADTIEMPSPFHEEASAGKRVAAPAAPTRLPSDVIRTAKEAEPQREPDLDALRDSALLPLDVGPDFPDEEPDYANHLRRSRRWKTGFGVALAAACIAVVGVYWFNHEPPPQAFEEQEPNDHPRHANELTAGEEIRGYIGKRLSHFESDRDMYRLKLGGSGRFVEIELSAIQNLDLAVDVLDGGGRPLARVNYDGMGQIETLHRLRAPTDELVLVVSEAKAGDALPTENVSDAYTLTARIIEEMDAIGEVEPNDTPPAANPYKAGERFTGYLDGLEDVDYYRLATDQVMDLRRWEIAVEADATLVPRITLFRLVGDDAIPIFADEGSAGQLHTVYEEPAFPNPDYIMAVAHSGRGERRGQYRIVADLLGAKSRIAHEPNDDRARATAVYIGEVTRGIIESHRDEDMFAIPVTDPLHRMVEIDVDPVVRDRVQLTISDINKANTEHFPPVPSASGRPRVPQPRASNIPIRFTGDGETYYLTVKARDRRSRGVAYSFRVVRVMNEEQPAAVGGPY